MPNLIDFFFSSACT
uniref:Uncharacterized protein n=1 Tax=Arundo donax TaxID=35708 RepID=A0A0A9B454_ARUDO